jgi:hypothetical protein
MHASSTEQNLSNKSKHRENYVLHKKDKETHNIKTANKS